MGNAEGMVSGRVVTSISILLVGLSACRGETTRRPAASAGTAGLASSGSSGTAGSGTEGGAPNETGGSSGMGGALSHGGAGAFAASGAGGLGGASGTSGASASSGSSGSGGAGLALPPGATEREREILAPLATSDETIDGADDADLFPLARAIGAARGYAMCRCGFSPSVPPEDVEELLSGCAVEESGFPELRRQDEVRCIEEGLPTVPGLAEYVRCRLKWVRDDGARWIDQCTDPDFEWAPPPFCTKSPEVMAWLDQCVFALYCADGTSVDGIRCDQIRTCTDESDELGCFEHTGRDWFWCDPELVHPRDVCSEWGCGLEKTPPVCDPTRPRVYLCDDGGEVDVESVCNRTFDCDDGSDERYCFK